MPDHDLTTRAPSWPPALLRARLDELILRAMAAATRDVGRGQLRVVMPSGRALTIGRPSGVEASITLNSYALFWKALRRGAIGAAESYIAGDFDTRDLSDVLRFFVDNEAAMAAAGRGFFRVRQPDRLRHRLRTNTRAGSRRNIAHHYDLGNDFYRTWLDASMTYSSALYGAGPMTLEVAQDAKYAAIIAALELAPGHDLLEIGCGWGRMTERAASLGARVTALTISREQLAFTRARLASAGLVSRAQAQFLDYRDAVGQYDRLVSIEMIEAVGEAHWPAYFRVVADRLRPGGIAVLQAITMEEARFQRYRGKPDFIQQYIFPGGMLPTVPLMAARAEEMGLGFEVVTSFGLSYVTTLAEWRRRFDAAWPELTRLGFDERFRRMWDYYLTYCAVGFERGAIDVGIYRLTKPATRSALAGI